MRVLVVEDYVPLVRSMQKGLEEAGYAVDVAEDGDVGLTLAENGDYDAIVLDLMLPKLDGLSLLGALRAKHKKTPVLVLTARDTVAERVRGLDLGADDYLVKPFAFEEFLARVRSIMRRRYSTTTSVVRVGDLVIDVAGRQVTRAGKALVLSAREYALLEYLATRGGQVVTRTEILSHVYDFRSEPASNVVDVYISYLRKKIDSSGLPRLIHTRRGLGYVLAEEP
jgi:DNA-binding response OmpR family regulator